MWQKEIFDVAQNMPARLALVDRYAAADLQAPAERERDLLVELRRNAQALLQARDEVDDAQARLAELPPLQQWRGDDGENQEPRLRAAQVVDGQRTNRDRAGLRPPAELAALRLELTPGGSEKIEAARGHDDLADALYLAAAPWKSGARLRCHLAELADRRRPEAPVPDLAGEVVETGGGLRLYRRPPLQSPAGSEVTLPEGTRPRGPRPSPVLLDARERVAEALQWTAPERSS